MVEILLGILACYSLVVIFVHGCYYLNSRTNKQRSTQSQCKHYIIMTKNNGNEIESVVRSLQFSSRRKGLQMKITCVDNGSTDDTNAIVKRLGHRCAIDLDLISGVDYSRMCQRMTERSEQDSSVIIQLHDLSEQGGGSLLRQ